MSRDSPRCRGASAVAACALEAWALLRRSASRAKAAARAADPESRALETDAGGLNARLHGARGSSRSFVGRLRFGSLRSPGHEKVGWSGAAAYKQKHPRLVFVSLGHSVSHLGPAWVLHSPALRVSLASFMVDSLPAFSAGYQDNEDADSDSPHPPNGLGRPFHLSHPPEFSLPP